MDEAARLLDAASGLVRIITLAPERDSDGAVTRWLSDQGVCVSAGHCNPTLDELRRAIDAGLVDVHAPGQRVPAVNWIGTTISFSAC